jgi:hypothetical protein
MDDEVIPDGLQPTEWGCPVCGERRTDKLLIGDEDDVECLMCGARYILDWRGTGHTPDSEE